MKIKVCCENVEDIIYAIDSVADAIESAKDAIENPEKPFSFDGLKKVIDTFNEKVKSREKSGSFSEFLNAKQEQQAEEEHQPKIDSFPEKAVTLHVPFWFEQGLAKFPSLTEDQQFNIIGAICNFAMMNEQEQKPEQE